MMLWRWFFSRVEIKRRLLVEVDHDGVQFIRGWTQRREAE